MNRNSSNRLGFKVCRKEISFQQHLLMTQKTFKNSKTAFKTYSFFNEIYIFILYTGLKRTYENKDNKANFSTLYKLKTLESWKFILLKQMQAKRSVSLWKTSWNVEEKKNILSSVNEYIHGTIKEHNTITIWIEIVTSELRKTVLTFAPPVGVIHKFVVDLLFSLKFLFLCFRPIVLLRAFPVSE